MSLKLYERDTTKEFKLYVDGSVFRLSSLADSYNYLRVYHTPAGAVLTRRLFLRNDDLSKYYANVVVSMGGYTVEMVGDDPYYRSPESPLLVKLHKGWLQPDSITWLKKDAFNSIVWPVIGTRNNPDRQYLPFWVAVEFVGMSTGQIMNELSNTRITFVIESEEYDHGRAQYKRYFK